MERRYPGTIISAIALALVVILASAGVAIAEPRRIDAIQAHTRAQAGKLVLVDVRTREEWQDTGVGPHAIPISMTDRAFLHKLDAAVGGDKTRPLALICASGVRSAMVARALSRYGYTRVYDVPEGMSGSRAGPGWLARGLPVIRP